ncbi:MAG: hypothetical protein IPQ00_18005 [Chloracidobacterium sp.]|nr:hypothetical protein [Chloracidobacterium sp.]
MLTCRRVIRKPQPTWAGAKNFERVVLLGTPSEGRHWHSGHWSTGLHHGININLPFVQVKPRNLIFSIPSAYQLLPAPGTFRVTDENFETDHVDLYNPKEWSRYGWNAINDKRFPQEFS